MKMNSKYFEQIRIGKSPQQKKCEETPKCQWTDCNEPGTHRAPVGRMAEGRYFRFCMEHVRKYNRDFNYFSGIEDSEIAKLQKEAITGDRPTWKVGTEDPKMTGPIFSGKISSRYARQKERLEDALGTRNTSQAKRIKTRELRPLEKSAFETLGLDKNATPETIKKRYSELIKRHHPDSNGGDRTSEKQFSEVLQAYRILKKSKLC